MSKRFTETEKWRHPSFHRLSKDAKLIQLYLWDSCDHAGIWMINFEIMSFEVGFKVGMEELKKWFSQKLFWVDEKRLFIPDFVLFQQKVTSDEELNPKNNAHKSIISTFNQLGISLSSPGKPLISPLDGSYEDPSKGKVKVKVKVEGQNFDFDALYQKYPRKDGKAKGLEICRKKITTQELYSSLSKAIDRYRANIESTKTEQKFVKHFSTFMGCWEDWIPSGNQTQSGMSNQALEYLELQEKLNAEIE